MPNIDPEQLAEGRRRLNNYRRPPQDYDRLVDATLALADWFESHAEPLLSDAEEATKASECLREILEYPTARSRGVICEIAARHGIDLGEQQEGSTDANNSL